MCVNDIVVQGAEPLFFLDYYATGRLEIETGRRIVAGIAEGCRRSGCALIGGETAEMPGMYAEGDYEFWRASRWAPPSATQLLPRSDIAAGDVVLGLGLERAALQRILPWCARSWRGAATTSKHCSNRRAST